MKRFPYHVVFVDRALSPDEFEHYLNLQWKDGWDYVSHISASGPKLGILMKKRDYPESHKVIGALMSIWGDSHITDDELFANLTGFLSEDPSELSSVREALTVLGKGGRAGVDVRFEAWLRGLKDRPTIAVSSGRVIPISDELLAALAGDTGPRKGATTPFGWAVRLKIRDRGWIERNLTESDAKSVARSGNKSASERGLPIEYEIVRDEDEE